MDLGLALVFCSIYLGALCCRWMCGDRGKGVGRGVEGVRMGTEIEAGDLVMVVRWPHGHYDAHYFVGRPFRVAAVSAYAAYCGICKEVFVGPTVIAEGPDGAVPSAWVKKLEPPQSTVDYLLSTSAKDRADRSDAT